MKPRGAGDIGTLEKITEIRPTAASTIGMIFAMPAPSAITFQLPVNGSIDVGVANAASSTAPHTSMTMRRLSFHGSIGRPARAAVLPA